MPHEIYSLNEETGALELGTVTALFKRTAQSTYRVEVGGAVIETTREHPFYVEDQGWTEAQDLHIGDFVDTLDGFTLPITGIEVVYEPTTVYNFSVNGNHNYYVSEDGVLVHNAGCNWVPNPGGRLGNAATKAKTQEVVDDLVSRGFTKIRKEVPFSPGRYGSGKVRFADVVGTNPLTKESEIVQIGRTLKSNLRIPVARERHAMDDIIMSPEIQNFPKSVLRFVDVNRPGVIQK